jgi:outer membrane receptor protein involved in Fe transport
VNLYAGYAVNPDGMADFSIENLLSQEYARYRSAIPVRRASPFPALPAGHAMTFAVPVSFELQ